LSAGGLVDERDRSACPDAQLAGHLHWLACRVDNATANEQITVVLVEKSATTKVRHGENGGRSLSHINVARAFAVSDIPAGGAGQVELTIPADLTANESSLVAMVQDRRTLRVSGASQIAIKQIAIKK